jgi:predicted DNA-binding transcriptional regulator AlpA
LTDYSKTEEALYGMKAVKPSVNPEDKFLTSREVGERYRLKSPVSVWQATKSGRIPKPLKIGSWGKRVDGQFPGIDISAFAKGCQHIRPTTQRSKQFAAQKVDIGVR